MECAVGSYHRVSRMLCGFVGKWKTWTLPPFKAPGQAAQSTPSHSLHILLQFGCLLEMIWNKKMDQFRLQLSVRTWYGLPDYLELRPVVRAFNVLRSLLFPSPWPRASVETHRPPPGNPAKAG